MARLGEGVGGAPLSTATNVAFSSTFSSTRQGPAGSGQRGRSCSWNGDAEVPNSMSLGLLDGREGTGSQPDGGVASNQRAALTNHDGAGSVSPQSACLAAFLRVPTPSRLCSWSRNSKTGRAPLWTAHHHPQARWRGRCVVGAWQQSRHAIRRHWSLWGDRRIEHSAKSPVDTQVLGVDCGQHHGALSLAAVGDPCRAGASQWQPFLGDPCCFEPGPRSARFDGGQSRGADSSCCERFRRLPWLACTR